MDTHSRRTARSACPYDCPDTCGLLVEADGDRVTGVKGDPEHPVTRGFLCRKMARYELSINHPRRILHPLRRTGRKGLGEFTRISWDEALAEIAGRWRDIIARHGGEAILPYSYSGVMSVIGRHCGNAFFNRMGASNLIRTICSSAKGAGWKALMGGTADLDPRDLAKSDFIVLWGSDVAATRLHSVPTLQDARRRGVPVVLIETYAGPAAAYADETILVRPGTDGALALSIIQALTARGLADRDFLAKHADGWDKLEPTLEQYRPEAAEAVTGVPAETIRRLAERYGRAAAPAILLGSGPSRHRNGAMNCRCVALLPAVVGAWGKPGAGTVGFGPIAGAPINSAAVMRPDFLAKPVRSVNMNQLAAALADARLDPPLRALHVYGSNPAAVTGNQKALLEQFAREDLFLTVHERFLTDTARFADIVLPATFSVEQADIHTCYGYPTLQLSRAVVPPPGECRSNWNAFCALAEAMGYEDEYFRRSEDEMVDHVVAESPLAEILGAEGLEKLRAGMAVELPGCGMPPFGTASGRIEIFNPALEHPLPRHLPLPDDGYPLRLVAAPSLYTLNSTFNERDDLAAKRGPLALLLNSDDARRRGIVDGGAIVCFNELAEVRCAATVTDAVPPGTVVAQGVHRPDACPGGLGVNALMRERISDMGEATTLNDNGVDVRAG